MCPSLDERGLVDRLATSPPGSVRYVMETLAIMDDPVGMPGSRPDVGWVDRLGWSTG